MKPNVLAMHSNFNDLKLKNMEAKKWYENSKYLYSLDEHDEGGFLGIDDNKVAEMLEEYHQAKLKLLGIADVSKRLEWLEQQMDETPPFKQAYNNLNERHGIMNKKELIIEYYKTNNVVYWADNRYSKEYVAWLERKLLKALSK